MRPVGRLALVTLSDVRDVHGRVKTALGLAAEALDRCGDRDGRVIARCIVDELLPAAATLGSWEGQMRSAPDGAKEGGRHGQRR